MAPIYRPQRKSPRLKGYDYTAAGVYFVTICTYGRLPHFGHIDNGVMNLSQLGRVAQLELGILSNRWATVNVDCYVVMPNHLHAIIVIESVGTPFLAPGMVALTLGQIVGNFKAGVTRIVHERALFPADADNRLWQSRYHDHIIRADRGLHIIRAYIVDNPIRWHEDTFFG